MRHTHLGLLVLVAVLLETQPAHTAHIEFGDQHAIPARKEINMLCQVRVQNPCCLPSVRATQPRRTRHDTPAASRLTAQ